MARRQERALALQREFLTLLEQLEPTVLLPGLDPLASPIPISEPMPPQLELPPPLSQEEIEALRALPMPDPLEEIEARLGLSTTPLSQQTWAG